MPRIAIRQLHRENTPADSPESYYRRNVMIPLLNHILVEMKERLGTTQQTKIRLLGLIPSIASSYQLSSISESGKVFDSYLPCPQLLEMEFCRWKTRFLSVTVDKQPSTLHGALKECDPDAFPNLRQLLVIACTLPITTYENE